jgi:hypothetical protein
MPDRAQEERERMTDERFAAWANEIGLTPAQADKVRYVIDREYERGVSSEAGHDGNQGLDDWVEGAGDEPKLYGGEDRVAELERALEDACSYLPPDIARRYLSLERFNAMFPEAGGWNG